MCQPHQLIMNNTIIKEVGAFTAFAVVAIVLVVLANKWSKHLGGKKTPQAIERAERADYYQLSNSMKGYEESQFIQDDCPTGE